MIDILLTVMIAFIFAPMMIGPFLVKWMHWVTARAVISEVSPDTLAPDVRTFIDLARPELEALGFQFIGYMTLADYMPKTTSFFGLFSHDARKTAAMAAVIQNSSGQTLRYCEFSNIYSNGYVIDVNNSPMQGGYKNPEKTGYRYPKISSIRKLYDINQWVTARDQRKSTPVGLVKGREAAMIADALDREVQLQAKYGYYVENETRTRYKMTWLGALILTEKQVFPVKQILAYLDLRKAGRAISGMPS
ncbi:MAG: hypothetical protein K4571_13685 [Deltaproteobacteria bacterium]